MIDEDVLMLHLDWHLTQGDPGQMLHHLTVMRAPQGAVGPLGLVDAARIQTAVYAIAPVGPVVEELIAGAVRRAVTEARDGGEALLFAALSMEQWVLAKPDELGRALMAQGRLEEHPDAVEATVVYAACRDGRRWRGRRYLTGPDAAQTAGAALLVGPPRQGESRGVPSEALLRRMVGMSR